MPPGSFVPGESSVRMLPLTDARKRGNSLFPYTLGNAQIALSALGLLACFLSRNRALPSAVYPSQARGPLKLQSLSPTGYNNEIQLF